MKLKFLFFTLFIYAISFSQNKGTITGVLLDKDANNQSLPFANVMIKDTKLGVNTDIDGKYSITIAPGNYTVQFSFLGYESLEVPVTVIANETVTLNNSLGSGSYKLKDVVIKSSGGREKETALLLDQKNAVVIKQSIGAQEMSRKGVSNVAEGLTKITGITSVGNRGLFVRGLEDRYNNLLINDLATPSNNPYNKYISLDLFPTDIVGIIDVYKTFNPNIYGDFAGGTFNVKTTKVSKSITKLNIGIGYTTNNSLSDFLIAEDANSAKGFFGLTANDRKLPTVLGNTATTNTLTSQQSLSAFKNSGFDVAATKSPLNSSISFLNAEKFDLSTEKSLSYLVSLSFENDFSITNGVQRNFTNDPTGFIYKNNFVTTDYTYEASFTGLVGLNYNTKKLKLSYNTIYIQSSANLIQDQFGIPDSTTGANNDVLIRTNQLDVSTYINNQLLGEYALSEDKNQTINAGVSYAITKFDQPDRKSFRGSLSGDNDISTSIAANNYIRQYLSIDSDYYFSGLAEYNYKFGKEEKNKKITVGYNGYTSNMESSYRFIIPSVGPNFTSPLNQPDDQLNAYVSNNTFSFRESSNSTWQAKLNQGAHAGYANLLYNFDNKWEVNGGLRVENTQRQTQYRKPGSFDEDFVIVDYNNLYFLPALNVKYGITETSNARFSATKTYTTPIIMEAYPIEYINADGTSTLGNPYLVNSDNYNVDLKYEIFPTAKEIFSVGLFGKKILTPIERTFVANASNTTITTYLNSDSAILYGAEIDFLYDLSRINSKLASFSWGFNTSLMYTQVKVAPTYINSQGTESQSIETHQVRELQGASKYIINSDLKYQFDFSPEWSNTISLVYSTFAKRIYAVGTGHMDNIYELPVNKLDFVWGSKVSKNIDLKFSIQNILNPDITFEQGNNGDSPLMNDPVIRNYKTGVSFSLNLGYTF